MILCRPYEGLGIGDGSGTVKFRSGMYNGYGYGSGGFASDMLTLRDNMDVVWHGIEVDVGDRVKSSIPRNESVVRRSPISIRMQHPSDTFCCARPTFVSFLAI